jgi:hypothetical protein
MAHAAPVQPPHVHHSLTRISPASALRQLQSYLEEASTEAHLQPNALLTLTGPTAANSSDAGGLVLYNLRRVEAGLRGEVLVAGDRKTDNVPMEDLPNITVEEEVAGIELVVDQHGGGSEGDWQDPESYSREQVDEVEGMGDRQTAIQDSGDVPAITESIPSVQSGDEAGQKKIKRKRAHPEKEKIDGKQNEGEQGSNKVSSKAVHATDGDQEVNGKSEKRKRDRRPKSQEQQMDRNPQSSQVPTSTRKKDKKAPNDGSVQPESDVVSSSKVLVNNQKHPDRKHKDHTLQGSKAGLKPLSTGSRNQEAPVNGTTSQNGQSDSIKVHSERTDSPFVPKIKRHKRKSEKEAKIKEHNAKGDAVGSK